jgi:hypothetical protein
MVASGFSEGGVALRTDPIRGCFDDLDGPNNGYLPNGRGSRVHELANGLRLGIVVLSLDYSGGFGHCGYLCQVRAWS